MIIHSKRVGTLEVKEDRIIRFDGGILGFPHLKQFILADDPVDLTMPFKWLVSVEDPEYTFFVTDPGIFFKDYVFDLSEEDREHIGAKSEDDITVITILTIPDEPKKMTANLRGPLVINWRTLVGRQLVLKDSRYQTKHFIFIQEEAATTQTAAAAAITEAMNTVLPPTDATTTNQTAKAGGLA